MSWRGVAFFSTICLAVALASVGCDLTDQANSPNAGDQVSSTRAVETDGSGGEAIAGASDAEQASRFEDAKLYCLGMMLYAQKHANSYPTNLDQTLPYLTEAKRLPTETNHFEIVCHGSMDDLPNPMTNGIVLIRSDAWQGKDGTWTRIYGFADGHCEAHSETQNKFDAWEKEHSLPP